MKRARVSVIKDNIQPGTRVPQTKNDCEIGQWIDNALEQKGFAIDKSGVVDMKEFGIDNKSRKRGSTASHTVGSMTERAIADTPDFKNTRLWHKVQNQNQIEYDPAFNEISDVHILDMDIPEIQEKLSEGYAQCREKLINGRTDKEIKSDNGWVVLDGYGHYNSRRMRITNKAMKKIKTISGNRDTFKKLFN